MDKAAKSRKRLCIEKGLFFAKDQWFLIGVGIIILISSQVQVAAQHQEIKQRVVSYLSVSIVFFVTGCTIPTQVLLENYGRWVMHIFVQVSCFLLTSALGYGVVSATASNHNFMDPWLLLGLILNAVQPTAISSNVVMTKQAHGNSALTVVETSLGNFLGPFISPVLFQMYLTPKPWYSRVLPDGGGGGGGGGYGSLYKRVFMQLGLSLYLPMVVGQVVRNMFPKATTKVFGEWRLNKLGSLALLTLLWQTFDHAFATGAFRSVPGDNMVFVVFICMANWLVWLTVAFCTSLPWLSRCDVVSVAYCVPAKTLALGIPLSTLLYTGISSQDQAKLQVPMVIFQCLQIALSSILSKGGNPESVLRALH